MNDGIYYRVKGGIALAFCRQFRDEWKAVEQKWSDYTKSKGGIGHVRFGRQRFGGIVFNREPSKGDGWKQHPRRTRDGTSFYVPYKAAKDLHAEINALPVGPADADICLVIGFPTLIQRDGGTPYGVVSVFDPVQIAWTDQGDNFFVVLPDVNKTIDATEKATTPRWIVPDDLEPSSRKRYELAVAQAAVDEDEK